MQELDQFKTKMLAWAKKLAKDLTALNKKIKAARPVVSAAPMGIVPGAYEGQILINKSPVGVKCYCWVNRDWNEIGEIDQQTLNRIAAQSISSVITRAGQSQEHKPDPHTAGQGHLFINYGTCSVQMVDIMGNWKLINSPLYSESIPTFTPETGPGTVPTSASTETPFGCAYSTTSLVNAMFSSIGK